MDHLRSIIEAAWESRELLKNPDTREAIREVVDAIDKGELRCASPDTNGWTINEWVLSLIHI